MNPRRALLARFEPGAVLARHRHVGDELIFMVEGANADESGRGDDRQHELPAQRVRPHRDDDERRNGAGRRLGPHGAGLKRARPGGHEIRRLPSDVRGAGSRPRPGRPRQGVRAQGRGPRLRCAVGGRALPGGARPLRHRVDVAAALPGPRGQRDDADPAGHRPADPPLLPSGHAGPRDPDALASVGRALRARRRTGLGPARVRDARHEARRARPADRRDDRRAPPPADRARRELRRHATTGSST